MVVADAGLPPSRATQTLATPEVYNGIRKARAALRTFGSRRRRFSVWS